MFYKKILICSIIVQQLAAAQINLEPSLVTFVEIEEVDRIGQIDDLKAMSDPVNSTQSSPNILREKRSFYK